MSQIDTTLPRLQQKPIWCCSIEFGKKHCFHSGLGFSLQGGRSYSCFQFFFHSLSLFPAAVASGFAFKYSVRFFLQT